MKWSISKSSLAASGQPGVFAAMPARRARAGWLVCFLAAGLGGIIVSANFGAVTKTTTEPIVAGAASSPAELSSRCSGTRGVLTAVVANQGTRDATYALRANALAPRRLVLAPDTSGELAVRGVGDGTWNLRLNENGVTVADKTVTVECDPIDNQTGVVSSCMAARGRVDVYIRNDEPTVREVTVTVSNAGRDYLRVQAVPSGAVRRVTVTGLRDGPVAVTLEGTGDTNGYRFRNRVGCAASANGPVPVVSIGSAQGEQRPHQTSSFTQGVTFSEDGRLFESSGAYQDQTRVREIDPATGAVVHEIGLGTDFFGEGLAAVGDRLWLLSWREGVARVLDQDTLAVEATYQYEGEGWGLCFDGNTLIRSDGTSQLYRHRLEDFVVIETITVTKAGEPVSNLNELECFDGSIWANVWYSDEVLRIEATSGAVDLIVDAAALERPRPSNTNAVTNGIALDPIAKKLWLTGKLWTSYRVIELPSV